MINSEKKHDLIPIIFRRINFFLAKQTYNDIMVLEEERKHRVQDKCCNTAFK